jgi:hypothetical protein
MLLASCTPGWVRLKIQSLSEELLAGESEPEMVDIQGEYPESEWRGWGRPGVRKEESDLCGVARLAAGCHLSCGFRGIDQAPVDEGVVNKGLQHRDHAVLVASQHLLPPAAHRQSSHTDTFNEEREGRKGREKLSHWGSELLQIQDSRFETLKWKTPLMCEIPGDGTESPHGTLSAANSS